MEKKFHELLREARLNAGYTQSQLAKMIGVAKSTYCNWEQGSREPNIIKLKVLAKSLGVSGDYLITHIKPMIQDRILQYEIADRENRRDRTPEQITATERKLEW